MRGISTDSPTALYACDEFRTGKSGRTSSETHGNMNDAPDAALGKVFKDGANLIRFREIGLEGSNFRGFSIVPKFRLNKFLDAHKRFWERIVVIVNGDDFVSLCLAKRVNDVRACRKISTTNKHAGWRDVECPETSN